MSEYGEKEDVMPKRKLPLGVKIISVLYYVSAAFFIFIGIILLVLKDYFKKQLEMQIPTLGTLKPMFYIFVGVVFIAAGVINIFIGRSLWKRKKWARIIVIVLSCLGIVGALVSMIRGKFYFSNTFSLVLNALIAGYLFFDKKVKSLF